MLDREFRYMCNGLLGMGYTVKDSQDRIVTYFGETDYYTGDPDNIKEMGPLIRSKYPTDLKQLESWSTNVVKGDYINPPLIFAVEQLEDDMREAGYLNNDYAPQWMAFYELGLNETYITSTGLENLDLMIIRVPGGWIYHTVNFTPGNDEQASQIQLLSSPVYVPYHGEFKAEFQSDEGS